MWGLRVSDLAMFSLASLTHFLFIHLNETSQLIKIFKRKSISTIHFDSFTDQRVIFTSGGYRLEEKLPLKWCF